MLAGCGDDAAAIPDLGLDGSTDTDAGVDMGPELCTNDQSCQDALFCNGRERCAPGPDADERGCVVAEGPPCLGGQTCSEGEGRCLTDCDISGDADRDGIDSIDCGGADCDDADANRFPGNAEVCDLEMHDEDCDPESFGYRDRDNDGFPDALCCNLGSDGEAICGNDCNDMLGAVHPTEAESCDELDNDCDGSTDEGVLNRYWPDRDGDDFGNGAEPFVESCMPPADYVDSNTDCDDDEARRNPGAPEVCDAIQDNDCNPDTQPFDDDGDGWDNASCGGADCREDDPDIHPGAAQICDRIDNNCSMPESNDPPMFPFFEGDPPRREAEDMDGDGHSPAGLCTGGPLPADDCNDELAHIYGGAFEHCNGMDDDCDPTTPDPTDCMAPEVLELSVLGNITDRRADYAADGSGVAFVAAEEEGQGLFIESFGAGGVSRWRRQVGGIKLLPDVVALPGEFFAVIVDPALNFSSETTWFELPDGPFTVGFSDDPRFIAFYRKSDGSLVHAESIAGSVNAAQSGPGGNLLFSTGRSFSDEVTFADGTMVSGRTLVRMREDGTVVEHRELSTSLIRYDPGLNRYYLLLSVDVGGVERWVLEARSRSLSMLWSLDLRGSLGFDPPRISLHTEGLFVQQRGFGDEALSYVDADGTEMWRQPIDADLSRPRIVGGAPADAGYVVREGVFHASIFGMFADAEFGVVRIGADGSADSGLVIDDEPIVGVAEVEIARSYVNGDELGLFLVHRGGLFRLGDESVVVPAGEPRIVHARVRM